MTQRALIVEDSQDIVETVEDILGSLGHAWDTATCQEDARKFLTDARHDYYLLDLEIPVWPDRGLPRIQNGANLLREIAALRGARHAPIIIMTGHGRTTPDLAVEMMKLGANGYITKPFATVGKTLDRAILDALARPPVEHSSASSEEAAPFCGGELVFYKDRVELCGVTVVRGELRIRKILEHLRERRPNGKYVAYSGAKLAQLMKICSGQNGIAEAVKDFRDDVESALKAKGIACGRKDILQSGGVGYRLAEWIVVREAYGAS